MDPPANGGEFLLQLLRRAPITQSRPPQPAPSQSVSYEDPAVAAAGPSISAFSPHRPWSHSSSPPFDPHNYFPQNPDANPNSNPGFSSSTGGFNWASNQNFRQSDGVSHSHDLWKLGFLAENHKPIVGNQLEQNCIFGSPDDVGSVLVETVGQRRLNGFKMIPIANGNVRGSSSISRSSEQEMKYSNDIWGTQGRRSNGFQMNSIGNGNAHGNSSFSRSYELEMKYSNDIRGKYGQNGNFRGVVLPPGFSSKIKNGVNREYVNRRRTWDHNADNGESKFDDLGKNNRRLNIEESMAACRGEDGDSCEELRNGVQGKIIRDEVRNELDDLEDQIVGSLLLEDEPDEKSDKKTHHRDKDYRSDNRGQWIMGQRMRNVKSQTSCRSDINRFNAPFLEVFESLIPAREEKVTQKQLLTVLEKLVMKEWPEARLYLYGSCANSFGFSKSDIDVCLTMQNKNIDKCEILLRLADILQSENLQNVQALTRARVPIVKLLDPVTGISCDICVNNVLAVVNTKLLRDYAQTDVRLRQLVFIVKHWAKSRRVNETYQGTLSSYAYVLMCIHFLQQRRPAILPCLQRMETTYFATVDDVECCYFDQVERLCDFGARNRESIAQLVWAFFHYWAYCHDYANDVISVRMGDTLSKRAKDWTRRVGNDRHLICIEDPFEVSHDLGRVVDKYSIRVLREEFERAAEIMQYDPNPLATLFEPYIPN